MSEATTPVPGSTQHAEQRKQDPVDVAQLQATLRRYRLALEEITDPMKFLRERAAASDRLLDYFYAAKLCADASYLQRIAVDALHPPADSDAGFVEG